MRLCSSLSSDQAALLIQCRSDHNHQNSYMFRIRQMDSRRPMAAGRIGRQMCGMSGQLSSFCST